MSGLQTKIHMDGDRMHVENVQDCAPILEDVQARHNEGLHGSSEFRHAARIPEVAVQIYLNNNGISFQEFMSNPVHIRRMLNDPELSKLRIWAGRV